ncbi:SAC3 family protein C [Aristolochia californica]|uniref:SAC3 family protein C n=1 Tax=Aristolochia californica TaxID=171875 RepID=UPI0035E0EAB4
MSRDGFRRAGKPQISSDSSLNSRQNRSVFSLRPHKAQQSSNHTRSVKEQRTEDGGESQNFPSVIGTCPDMCPAKERAQREQLRDLSIFERLNGDPRKTSPSLAVKKFCRTISSQNIQPSDIRPLHVLQDTLKYLMNILHSSEYSYEVVHDFVFDRTRSIRQDLSMQNINNDQAIHMYEEMVKFYVISHNKLAKHGKSSNLMSLHYLNKEQLVKSLVSLYDLYRMDEMSTSIRRKAAEFYSLYILLHLGSNSQSMGESLSIWLRHLPSPVLKSKEMSFARSILRYVQIGNYLRFFRTIAAEASDLQFYLLEPFINEVRAQAISFINHGGYKLYPYPLADLSEILMMQESELESLCVACALETWTDETGVQFLPTKQTSFCLPKEGFQQYSFSGLAPKASKSWKPRDDVMSMAKVAV